MKKYKMSNVSLKHLNGVRDTLKCLIERSISKSKFDFGIPPHGGKRSAEEQKELFDKKVSRCDGFKNKSYHQSGNAFDIFLYDKGKASWTCLDKYRITADLIKKEFALMKEEGIFEENTILKWGGDWKTFKDYPHFEIR